ncbi:hypothetical protein JANAI62_23200 [Jannaschia pagri]|uniref:Uncharacterized protein n=1 Tax=Jannaschia pagri TaxID=2829797 RepID=A0ABQ4NNK7_9RHOB|nr:MULTISPECIES: hypothetical protein [unclassified Jannaschia]GIT91863.1 hypothetical protein JANAI61_23210 [Jannaschia sp. AI_61]GIT95697.1 hypothetical protein JANAI62_23200 [Jannaschia sp. AI_62]
MTSSAPLPLSAPDTLDRLGDVTAQIDILQAEASRLRAHLLSFADPPPLPPIAMMRPPAGNGASPSQV